MDLGKTIKILFKNAVLDCNRLYSALMHARTRVCVFCVVNIIHFFPWQLLGVFVTFCLHKRKKKKTHHRLSRLPRRPNLKIDCRKSKKVRSKKKDLDWPAWLRMFRSVGVSWWFIINMVKGLRVGSSSASHGLITIK